MKFFIALFLLIGLCPALAAAQPPAFLAELLKKDQPVKAQIGVVMPPAEINKYVAKVEASARENPEWFETYRDKAKPGVPLPYDEKLGLTREEYDEYLKLWKQREFKPTEEVMLLLRQSSGDTWTITSTGKASTLATLRYLPEKDVFRSPNGVLERIEDIDAEADSILGAWSGREWKFAEETTLGKTKVNLALGRYDDGKTGLIVYRVQELTSAGTRLLDKSLVIRFPMAKPEK